MKGHLARNACVAGLLALAAFPGQALAQSGDSFFRGRTIQLVIASGEGGGYDISARLLAEFLPRHIPGKPVVVPQNMPGASGIRAADYMFNVAARDGTTLSIPQPSIIFNKLIDPSARYEPQNYTWIGRLAGLQTYGIVGADVPFRTIDQIRENEIIIAAAQGTGTGAIVSAALTQLAGLKLKVVRGYKSVAESGLALERGEVQGISSVSWEFLESKGWTKGQAANFLYVVGLRRNPRTPEVPTIVDLVTDKLAVETMKIVAMSSEIGRSIHAPPQLPAERRAILEKAFMETMQDQDFLAEAARRNIEVEPMGGDAIAAMVAEAMHASPAATEGARKLFGM